MLYVTKIDPKKEYGLAPDPRQPGPARDRVLLELAGKIEHFARRGRIAEIKADLGRIQTLIAVDALYTDKREERISRKAKAAQLIATVGPSTADSASLASPNV